MLPSQAMLLLCHLDNDLVTIIILLLYIYGTDCIVLHMTNLTRGHFFFSRYPSVDPAAASYVNMNSKCALHRHRALEIAGPRDYFGPSRSLPPGARMRVVTFAISTFGSF